LILTKYGLGESFGEFFTNSSGRPDYERTYMPGLPDFSWNNVPNLGKNIPNDYKITK
jgi:hypothetical protein